MTNQYNSVLHVHKGHIDQSDQEHGSDSLFPQLLCVAEEHAIHLLDGG